MADSDLQRRISGLSDVDLVRLLTTDAQRQSVEALTIAEAEAQRRGVPIDDAFIPPPTKPQVGKAAGRFEAGGREVACGHCQGLVFQPREVLLNSRGLTFLNLDWLNRSATALVCANCGLVQLFTPPPTPVDQG